MRSNKNIPNRYGLLFKNKIVRNKIGHQIQYSRGSPTSQIFECLKRDEFKKIKVKKLDKRVNELSQR